MPLVGRTNTWKTSPKVYKLVTTKPANLANVTHKIPHNCCALPGCSSPCILVKETVRIKEILQKKCFHSSQAPKVVNIMSLEIFWEV